MEKLKRVVIKEELVELVGDFRKAIILNQFVYWSSRTKDYDKWIKEEEERANKSGTVLGVEESKGWIYKSAEELNDETMMKLSLPTLRKLLKELIGSGYIQERRNPKYKWDKTMQYRVDLVKIQTELNELGYSLEGFKLLTIENKKAPKPLVEEKGTKKNSTRTNSICNSKENNTSNEEINKDVNVVSEVVKAINESCVNIKKSDLEECEKLFTDIDRLKKALKVLEEKNGHGIKALKGAYKRDESEVKANGNSNSTKGLIVDFGDNPNKVKNAIDTIDYNESFNDIAQKANDNKHSDRRSEEVIAIEKLDMYAKEVLYRRIGECEYLELEKSKLKFAKACLKVRNEIEGMTIEEVSELCRK